MFTRMQGFSHRSLFPCLLMLPFILLLVGCGNDGSPAGPGPVGATSIPRLGDGPNYVLYSLGVFDSPEAKYPLFRKTEYAEQVASSGFTAVIHAFLHVYPDGSLVMNDTKLVYADGSINLDIVYMKDLYAKVRQGGKVKILLALGGGWGAGQITSQSDHDYSRILQSRSLYPSFAANPIFKNLLIAKKFFEFDGLDLDFEPYNADFAAYNQTYMDLLADLTRWATANGLIVTYGVYTKSTEFWGPLLEKTIGEDGTQLVSLVNLQGYGGSGFGDWVTAFAPFNIGVHDKERLLCMGYPCHDPYKMSAKQVYDALMAIRGTHSGLNSAFLWQYSDIVDGLATETVAAFKTAIAKGIAGEPYP
jgi:hypothetical protein